MPFNIHTQTESVDRTYARSLSFVTTVASNGTTIFLSTHILPVVEQIATTVGILYDGELVAEGPLKELKDRMEMGAESTLEDVFLEVTTDATDDSS